MLVIIRGAGDIATGIGHRLYMSGFDVIFLEKENPSMVRRKVSFSEAVYEDEITIENLTGKLSDSKYKSLNLIKKGIVPVMIDPYGKYIEEFKPKIIVDGILAKKNIGTYKDMAEIVIGVGPGFSAGEDVHTVVETKRGHMLGRVIYKGIPEPNTGIPGNIEGFTEERVLRAKSYGNIKVLKDIGTLVEKGDIVATIGECQIETKISGVIRGMIRDKYYVYKGMKIGDVDPRGEAKYSYQISDKARSVAGGVLEAIMYNLYRKNNNEIK
ncbi:selenium-dependent molybdenum cofactor biosynthesis protein YqeB [Senegalia massiliensis]|uniref:selenium-dependent molybdenum cofactor biosynthesis protein YqeB n=1 Tax=Senegalia massiliensis TaxID=1720316 RepID=UPI001F5F4973|nr:selenium-dependent molybdenum cofactor biosynthesis protein YqeB [Senegalia massiliensis]